MDKIKVGDIYVFTYYDKQENEISMSYAENLEDFEQACKVLTIIGWVNITGTDIEIRDFEVNNTLQLEKENG